MIKSWNAENVVASQRDVSAILTNDGLDRVAHSLQICQLICAHDSIP